MFFIFFVIYTLFTVAFVQPVHCEIKTANESVPLPHSSNSTISDKKIPQNILYSQDGAVKVESTVTKPEISKDSPHSRGILNTASIPDDNQYSNLQNKTTLKSNVTSTRVDKNTEKNATKAKDNISPVSPKELKPVNKTADKDAKSTNSSNSLKNATLITSLVNPSNQSTTTTTTPTTPATTKSTATTTTEIPKKPIITYSVEDVPGLLDETQKESQKEIKDEDNGPRILQSSEIPDRGHDFLVPLIAMIFVVPLLVILANGAVRRVRDYWSKRKYRRMDYLIEDMYN